MLLNIVSASKHKCIFVHWNILMIPALCEHQFIRLVQCQEVCHVATSNILS
jgi:hypothetical protein